MNQELFHTIVKTIIISKNESFVEDINQMFVEKRGSVVKNVQAYYSFFFTCLAENIDIKKRVNNWGSDKLTKHGEKQIWWFDILVNSKNEDIKDTFHPSLLTLARYDIPKINDLITRIANEQDGQFQTRKFLTQHLMDFSENETLTSRVVNFADPSSFNLLQYAFAFSSLNRQINTLVSRKHKEEKYKEVLDEILGDDTETSQALESLFRKRDSIIELIHKIVSTHIISELNISNDFVDTFFKSPRYDSNVDTAGMMLEIAMSILASQTPIQDLDRSKLIRELPECYATYFLPSLTEEEMERVPQYYKKRTK